MLLTKLLKSLVDLYYEITSVSISLIEQCISRIDYVLELVYNSIFPYPETSITAHIAELLLPIAWAEQNQNLSIPLNT